MSQPVFEPYNYRVQRYGFNDNIPIWSALFASLSVVSLLCSVALIVKSKSKLREITKPLKNITWNQSYCKLTLHLVYVVIAAQWFNIIVQIIRILGFSISNDAYQMYEYRGDQFSYCNHRLEEHTQYESFIHMINFAGYGHISLFFLNRIIVIFVCLIYSIQTYEWIIQIHLIRSQANKSIE